jgi:hypothetical protein
MGHGTPLKTGGLDDCGAYMLDENISSTHIAALWGLMSLDSVD